MKKKEFEIYLSQNYRGFINYNITYEQYDTPINIASNLIFTAQKYRDVENKNIIDLGAGPGILGISSLLMNAKHVSFVELDPIAIYMLEENLKQFNIKQSYKIFQTDASKFKTKRKFDTCIMNPPFGIKQHKQADKHFLLNACKLATTIYSIHDGTKQNLDFLQNLLMKQKRKITECYYESFTIPNKYKFHTKQRKKKGVLIIRSTSS